ncbi:unnamed protein product [Mytilus coruscus]|uniref:Uncharacterized protein n=1 Tax=Mytilus coruscus TaxID=42192 RepID=A0A6J8EPE1_MYTCO|nr:unnamed protein product [Mytilus coruscus]
MDTSQFITFFKKQLKPPLLDIYRQYENLVEAKTPPFIIPQGESPKHKFVHGKIFEDNINQAATNCKEDRKLIEEFKSLYEEFCKRPRNVEEYFAGMKHAGLVAWNIVRYMQLQHVSFTFGHRVKNEYFKMLRPNVLIDFIQPTLIYDFKLSTAKSQEEYEQKYLVSGLIQVLIYYLCMGLSPENAKLGVLVFYSSLNKIVFYTSNVHKDGFCVKLLKDKMHENKHSNDSDTDTMPNLEPITTEIEALDTMPKLELLTL